MSLTTRASARLALTSKSSIDLGSKSANIALELALELASGTGAGEADLAFVDTRTLAASGTENLDLAGALTDPLGAAASFARVKLLVVQAAPGNANNVEVTRPGSNGAPLFLAAGDGVSLRPGEFFLMACRAEDATGHVVTGGTGDLITVTNSGAGTSVTYSIAVVGCSA